MLPASGAVTGVPFAFHFDGVDTGFAFHFDGVDTGSCGFCRGSGRLRGFRLRQWLKRRRIVAVLKEFEAGLREQRHGED
ncbi:hypothetical protein LTSEMIN_0087, partial [Salmonella enterica subsp. enterica serovar Minnesota str. A4-603]